MMVDLENTECDFREYKLYRCNGIAEWQNVGKKLGMIT